MRTIIQRVKHSSVSIDGEKHSTIGPGIMALIGFGHGDTSAVIEPILSKIINLRIFPDERGRFHNSLLDIKGDLMLVPQFTLFADTSRGRRPEFFEAAHPDIARPLFEETLKIAAQFPLGIVAGGVFGANMQVLLENDGPVTISIGF